jgi:serine/threonine protein kinase
MKVYCTRSRQKDETPHLTEIPDQKLKEAHQCAICGMPLILQGRYVPISELGEGGFGYTFSAFDLMSPERDSYRKIAIKQLRFDRLLFEHKITSAKSSFDREYNTLAQLKYQGIPTVYHPFQLETPVDTRLNKSPDQKSTIHYYFVQEYIRGEDLAKRLKNNGSFSELEILDLLQQMLPILEYLHTQSPPIIHRDIKPANIIRREDGTYHLIDFGAVKQIIAAVTVNSTQTLTRIGTSGFSAPEQFAGEAYFSSDLYALGKTCLHLLSVKPAPLITNQNTRLIKILDRMTAEDPQQRYQTTKDVQTALDRLPHNWNMIVGGITVMSIALLIIYNYRTGIFNHSQDHYPISIKIFAPTKYKKIEDAIKSINVPSGEFTYCCSKTWGSLPEKIKQSSMESVNYFKLNFKYPSPERPVNSETGVEMVIDGKIDIALTSKEVSPELKSKAQQKNITLMETSIGRSSVVVVVNPGLRINNIQGENITKIENKGITNWKELTSFDHKINIYATDNKNFREGSFIYTRDTKESLDKVANDKYGFAMVPINWVKNRCDIKILSIDSVSPFKQGDNNPSCPREVDIEVMKRARNRYLKIATLRVVIRDDNLAGKAYITMLMSEDVQRIIGESGYLPINESR